jgi:hypothetical protein
MLYAWSDSLKTINELFISCFPPCAFGFYSTPRELRVPEKKQVFKVWEDRFDDAFLSDSQMLNVKLDYIHTNPLQEHWILVSKPEDYTFSSARFYESGEKSNCEGLISGFIFSFCQVFRPDSGKYYLSAMQFKVAITTIYNCSLARAFKSPMLCDISKVHTGFGLMPKITHSSDYSDWGSRVQQKSYMLQKC